jgi:hypothetical protein
LRLNFFFFASLMTLLNHQKQCFNEGYYDTVFGNFYFCHIGSITQFRLVDLEYSTKSSVSCQTITIRTEVPTQNVIDKNPPCEMKFRSNRNFH